MTDSEVEEWEKKVKSALLRRDDSLGNLLNSMTSAMYKGYTVNGKSYSLSSFGISTLGYLNADENEENAYHIDGDADDSAVSSKTNKLKQMLQEDPDTVTAFMQQLVTGVYNEIDTKMRSNSLSSAMTVYNDKQMAKSIAITLPPLRSGKIRLLRWKILIIRNLRRWKLHWQNYSSLHPHCQVS